MNYIQSSSMVSTMSIPPLNNISKDIITKSDTNSDSSLSIDEVGVSQDLFAALDSSGDSLVTSNEIASAIDAKLSQFNGEMPSKEEFQSLLSDLGLEMPEAPQLPTMEESMASDIMAQYDTNADSLLSSEELSLLSDEEFLALDSNSDGAVSSDELSSVIEQVASSKQSAPSGGGGNMSGSSEEEYDEADTNEDGIVSFEEKMAALGVDITFQEESENSTNSQTASNEEMLETIKMLFETIKTNTTQNDEKLDLGNFKNLMTMVNNQSNNSELNAYVSNLASSSSKFNYA